MSTEQNTTQQPLRILEQADGERQVVFHTKNNDLFVRTGKQVVDACRHATNLQAWFDDLNSMLEHVAHWCEQRADHIQACYAAPQGNRVALYFIPHGTQFNFDLADLLADLSRELITDFNVGMIEVHQIPADELETFVQPVFAAHVYGDSRPAHPAVEA